MTSGTRSPKKRRTTAHISFPRNTSGPHVRQRTGAQRDQIISKIKVISICFLLMVTLIARINELSSQLGSAEKCAVLSGWLSDAQRARRIVLH